MVVPSSTWGMRARVVLLIGVVASALILGMVGFQQDGVGEISTLSDGHVAPAKGQAKKIDGRKEKLHLSPDTLAVVKDQKVVDSLSTRLQKAQEKLGSMAMRQLAEMKKESLESPTSELSQQKESRTAKVRSFFNPSRIKRGSRAPVPFLHARLRPFSCRGGLS